MPDRERGVRHVGSTRSNASTGSIGLGPSTPGGELDVELIGPRPEGACPVRVPYDAVLYLVYCLEHNKFAMTKIEPNTYWLPFVLRNGQSWIAASKEGLNAIFERKDADGTVVSGLNTSTFNNITIKPLELFRVQCRDPNQWCHRLAQFVTIPKCSSLCAQSVNSVVWISATDLLESDYEHFWGPEINTFYEYFFTRNVVSQSGMQMIEKSFDWAVFQLTDQGEKSRSSHTDLMTLVQSRIPEGQQNQARFLYHLYDNFLHHAYPSYYLNPPSWRVYLLKSGFKNPNIWRQLYNTAIRRPKRSSTAEYLDFHDVVYLMIAMDPATPNDRNRLQFVFNFYNQDGDDALNNLELAALLGDLPQKAKAGTKSNQIKFHDFYKMVQENKLPGTDQLLRLPRSSVSASSLRLSPAKKLNRDSRGSSESRFCSRCKKKLFEYAQYCVTIDYEGHCVQPTIILDGNNQTVPKNKLRGKKYYQAEYVWNSSSLGNTCFDFARNPGLFKQMITDSKTHNEQLLTYLSELCEHIRILLRQEPKLVKRPGPALVVGEIGGNMQYLQCLDRQLWTPLPIIHETCVFLGNYTGKGEMSLETLTYMLALKYLAPNQIVLLRGIRETRGYNEKTLLPEWTTRFGAEVAQRLWELINDTFEQLPYACVINETIFCTSSGMPREAINYKVSALFENCAGHVEVSSATSASATSQHRSEHSVFHQFLANIADLEDDSRMTTSESRSVSSARSGSRARSSNSGGTLFLPNPLHPNAYIFTQQACRKFLQLNNYSVMIRANECRREGYRLTASNRCLTLASSRTAESVKSDTLHVALIKPEGRLQITQLQMDVNVLQVEQSGLSLAAQ